MLLSEENPFSVDQGQKPNSQNQNHKNAGICLVTYNGDHFEKDKINYTNKNNATTQTKRSIMTL